jgi:hypothetical protein
MISTLATTSTGAVYVWRFPAVRCAGSTDQQPRDKRRDDYYDVLDHWPPNKWRAIHRLIEPQRRTARWEPIVDNIPFVEKRELVLIEHDFIAFYRAQGCDMSANVQSLRVRPKDRLDRAGMRLLLRDLRGAEACVRWLWESGAYATDERFVGQVAATLRRLTGERPLTAQEQDLAAEGAIVQQAREVVSSLWPALDASTLTFLLLVQAYVHGYVMTSSGHAAAAASSARLVTDIAPQRAEAAGRLHLLAGIIAMAEYSQEMAR